MKRHTLALLALSLLSATAGEKALFNGKDLTGWEGNTTLWSVVDGAITGKTTVENPTKGNTFLIWKAGEVADFELTFQYKFTVVGDKPSGNSGMQYRSKVVDEKNFVVSGYQADFEVGDTYSGILYEEKARGILAQRGQSVKITAGGAPAKPKIEVTGSVGDSKAIQALIKKDGWNEFKVIAKGGHLQHFINGKATVDVTDETAEGAKKGILALQLHAGPPMQVQFKDIFLKED
jgi:hypothetical protein